MTDSPSIHLSKLTLSASLWLTIALTLFGIWGCEDAPPRLLNPVSPPVPDVGLLPTPPQPLLISNVTPSSGATAGGGLVVIEGTGFREGILVFFGELPATSMTIITDTHLSVIAPPASPGVVDVRMQLDDVEVTLPNAYRYESADALELYSIRPQSGSVLGGEVVILRGSGFRPGMQVRFGEQLALEVEVSAENILTCVAPPHGAGTVDLIISAGDDEVRLPEAWTYHDDQSMLISALTPSVGAATGGELVMVSGLGFTSEVMAFFDDIPADVLEVPSEDVLLLVTPPHPGGEATLTLRRPSSDSETGYVETVKARAYTFERAVISSTKLSINRIFPPASPEEGGNPVVVTGTGFEEGVVISFGDQEAETTFVDSETAVAIAPAGTGGVSLSLSNPDGGSTTVASGITYRDPEGPPPQIELIQPSIGPSVGGSLISLSGSHFTTGAMVLVDQHPASAEVLDAERATVTIPEGAPGSVDITLINPDGQSSNLADGFSYFLADQTSLPPVVTAVVPALGWIGGGDEVRVTGANFGEVPTVYFGTEQATVVGRAGANTLRVQTPTQDAGSQPVTVTTLQGLSGSLPNGFVYFDYPPALFEAEPAEGPLVGGQTVTLRGAYLTEGAEVRIDQVLVSHTLNSDRELSFLSPPHASGDVDIEVTLSNGLKATLAGGYRYSVPASALAPSISALSPAMISANGGQTVVMSGAEFSGGARVFIGEVEVSDVRVLTPEVLTFTAPAGAPGSTWPARVMNSDGQEATREAAMSYAVNEELAPLSAVHISPSRGSIQGGESLLVIGDGFTPEMSAIFGETEAPTVIYVSPQVINIITPAVERGARDLLLRRSDQHQLVIPDAFLFEDEVSEAERESALSLFRVEPSLGPTTGQTPLTLVGQGFTEDTAVYLGDLQIPNVTFVSPQELSIYTPAHAMGSVSIMVSQAESDQTSILASGFTYFTPRAEVTPPQVFSAQPHQGSLLGGEELTIFGEGFQPGVSVLICGASAGVSSQSDETLIVQTPQGALGRCDVDIVNPDGQSAQLEFGFRFVAPTPVVSLITPALGSTQGGTQVLIRGDNFVEGSAVTFGGDPALLVEVWDQHTISARAPSASSGTVAVRVTNPGGSSAILEGAFTFSHEEMIELPPSVQQLEPSQGPLRGGTPVEIFGDHFMQGMTVRLGDRLLENINIINEGHIVLITPPHTGGQVDLTVFNPNGLGAHMSDAFEYVQTDSATPEILGIAPASGPVVGGQPVTISGDHFVEGGIFYLGSERLTSLTMMNSQLVTGLTPPALEGGEINLRYVAPNGEFAQRLEIYTYIDAPELTSIGPTLGPEVGGTEVVLVGRDFQRGAQVFVDAQEVELVTFINSERLVISTPASSAGFATIRVVNPDQQESVLTDAFEYLAPPQITSVDQAVGPEVGGTLINLYGTGFTPGSLVFFGDTVAEDVVRLGSDHLVIFTPPHAVGSVLLRVRNPDGQEGRLEQGFQYSALFNLAAAPTAEFIFPYQGVELGEESVLVMGRGFTDETQVFFGLLPALNVEFINSSMLRVITPPGADLQSVRVMNIDGQMSDVELEFTYLVEAPVINTPLEVSAVDPINGPISGGSEITLSGAGFVEPVIVLFGDQLAEGVSVVDEETITLTTPASAPDEVEVTVIDNLGQTYTFPVDFRFISPPNLISLQPTKTSVVGGVTVSAQGADFETEAPVTLKLCQDHATDTGCFEINEGVEVSADGQTLTFTTPPAEVGVLDVVIINPDGQESALLDALTYQPTPIVESVQPESGSTLGGLEVTVRGDHFQEGITVRVGDAPCGAVNLLTADTLTCTLGEGTAGLSSVEVFNPDLGRGSLLDSFTYIPPPQIASISPTIGAEVGGARVTITGSGFTQESEVRFGGLIVPNAERQVISAEVISLIAPPGEGVVAISIHNADGQEATRGSAFTYIPPAPAPTINYAVPNRSETIGGELVQIVGSGFLDGAQVLFGRDPNWYEADVIDVTNRGTLIRVYSPAIAEIGSYDILVRNSDGQEAIKRNSVEYVESQVREELDLIALSPATSLVAGGQFVTVSGRGFVNGIEVYFGKDPEWVLAPTIEWFGATVMRVEVPSSYNGLPGTVDVKVVNPPLNGPDEYIAEDAFNYTADAVLVIPDDTRIPPEEHGDRLPLLGDFTGDGLNDVIVFRDNQARLMTNTPHGDSPAGKLISSHLSINQRILSADKGDVDGDGDLDVVYVAAEQWDLRTYLCYNNGVGDFSCKNIYTFNRSCDDRGTPQVYFAELSCDGALDIFITSYYLTNTCPNRLLVSDGQGKTFSSLDILPRHFEDTRAAAFGDVDLDGDTDILLANDNAMQNRLYLNNCSNHEPAHPGCYVTAGACTTSEETFEGKTYKWCDSGTSWSSANQTCQSHGGELATPTTVEEFEFLRTLTNRSVWVGWRDESEEGEEATWISVNDESQPIWCNGYPRNDQPYVYWSMGSSCMYTTTSTSMDYLCEINPAFSCEGFDQWSFTDAQPGVNFPISGGNTRDVKLVDLNRDGYLDAIIGNSDQRKNVYINEGGNFQLDDGTYWPQNEEDNSTAVRGLNPVDIDLDGDYDFIVYADDKIRIYENDYSQGGQGALTEVTDERLAGHDRPDGTTTYEVIGDDQAIAIGDMDGDLLPDIYIVNHFYTDRLLMNAGYSAGLAWAEESRVDPGHFEYNTLKELPDLSVSSRETELVDYDLDGDLDIIQCTSEGIYTFDNIGGRFVNTTGERFSEHSFDCATRGLEVVDINGDDFLDVMALSRYNEPGRPHMFINQLGFFQEYTSGIPFGNYRGWSGIFAVNFDHDQDTDFLLTSDYGHSSYYAKFMMNGGDVYNTGATYFIDRSCDQLPCNSSLTYIREMQVTYINDDMNPDLYVVRNGQNQLLTSPGGGEQLVNVTSEYLPALSDNSYASVFFDSDLDGDLDIYVGNQGQDRFLVRESEDKFSDITASSLPNQSQNTRALDVADLNNDGFPEIIMGNYEQGNLILSNYGGNQFNVNPAGMPFDLSRTVDIDLFDFDGDGDLDAYITNIGQDYLYLNPLND